MTERDFIPESYRHRIKRTAFQVLREVNPRWTHRFVMKRVQKRAEPEMKLLELFVDPAREAVDAGANVGVFSVSLMKLCRHVHAFEPDVGLSRFLRRAGYPNVTVHTVGLSDREGTGIYKVPLRNGRPVTALGSLEEPITQLSKFETRQVPLTTLDGILHNSDIGFMKIDVEGHEAKLLRGAVRLLRLSRPSLLIEIAASHGQDHFDAVLSFLANLGYEVLFIHDERAKCLNELTESMRRPTTWDSNGRRNPSEVFNFFFVHGEGAAKRMALSINHFLRPSSGDEVLI